jgi:hypothetical protein
VVRAGERDADDHVDEREEADPEHTHLFPPARISCR